MACALLLCPPQGGLAGANSEAVFQTLLSLINNGTHSGLPNAPTGGIVFTKFAWPVLTEGGKLDVALDLMVARGMPSYDYWQQGTPPATTLWENWQSTATAPLG